MFVKCPVVWIHIQNDGHIMFVVNQVPIHILQYVILRRISPSINSLAWRFYLKWGSQIIFPKLRIDIRAAVHKCTHDSLKLRKYRTLQQNQYLTFNVEKCFTYYLFDLSNWSQNVKKLYGLNMGDVGIRPGVASISDVGQAPYLTFSELMN